MKQLKTSSVFNRLWATESFEYVGKKTTWNQNEYLGFWSEDEIMF